MSTPYTWIGDDCPPVWKRVGTIDVADPADVVTAQDRGCRIGSIYDGGSGSVAEPCAADLYEEVDIVRSLKREQSALSSSERAETLAILDALDKAERDLDAFCILGNYRAVRRAAAPLTARLRSAPSESPYSDGKEWGSMFKNEAGNLPHFQSDTRCSVCGLFTCICDIPRSAPPEPAQGEVLERCHPNDRDAFWRSAKEAADTYTKLLANPRWEPKRAHIEGARNAIRTALSSLPPAGDTVAVKRETVEQLAQALSDKEVTWQKRFELRAEISRLLDGTPQAPADTVAVPREWLNYLSAFLRSYVTDTDGLMFANEIDRLLVGLQP